MSRYIQLIIVSCIAIIMSACNKGVVFTDVTSIPTTGWHQDSCYSYVIDIQDTTKLYELDMVLRNNSSYQNQNIWLSITQQSPIDSAAKCDTINIILADEFGRWNGGGIGDTHTNVIVFQDSLKYNNKGNYTYCISHLMRYIELQGITAIGLQLIEKQ